MWQESFEVGPTDSKEFAQGPKLSKVCFSKSATVMESLAKMLVVLLLILDQGSDKETEKSDSDKESLLAELGLTESKHETDEES